MDALSKDKNDVANALLQIAKRFIVSPISAIFVMICSIYGHTTYDSVEALKLHETVLELALQDMARDDTVIIIFFIVCIINIVKNVNLLRFMELKKKVVFVIGLCVYFVTAFVWYSYDYVTYYDTRAYNGMFQARYQFKMVSELLYDDSITDDDRKQQIRDLHELNDPNENRKIELKITKNNELYFEKNPSVTLGIEPYHIVRDEIIHVGDDVYVYNQYYYVKPNFFLALVRGTTLSIIPDFLCYDLDLKSFFVYKLYNRSFILWTLFVLLWTAVTWTAVGVKIIAQAKEHESFEREKAEHEVEIQRIEAEKQKMQREQAEQEAERQRLAVENLNKFKLAYETMFWDFDNEAVNKPKQDMQVLEVNWIKMINQILADERHDLKNRLTEIGLNDLEKDLYSKLLTPFKETLLVNLRKLPDMLDYRCSPHMIKDIIKSADEAIPAVYKKGYDFSGIHFKSNNSIDIEMMTLQCNVNLPRIRSITANLINNAGQAIQKHEAALLDKDIFDYEGVCELNYDIINKSGVKYLSINVKDNAGGFPDDIINKVYKVPIKSKNNSSSERTGEGTMYVAFFAEIMKADLVVGNIVNSENQVGASVEVLIPIM